MPEHLIYRQHTVKGQKFDDQLDWTMQTGKELSALVCKMQESEVNQQT
jgi:hypothetical protein